MNTTIGVNIPEILLPKEDVSLEKWAVVACDQYTSQLDYWQEVEDLVGYSASTLHMVFPEVYLEESDEDKRISNINQTMKNYLKDGILEPQAPGFIYVERQVAGNAMRKGIMIAVDLECYDYTVGSQTLIRATEGTVLDRLPPRIKIRENAPLELPHIMLLIDDPAKTVIEPLTDQKQKFEKAYDFDLMKDGGNIVGYKIETDADLQNILSALKSLADKETFCEKYQLSQPKDVLLFAVGDGNHSLATAKACWEQIKTSLSDKEQQNHPARFALVEVVNVHDDALVFEPIHRVVFNVDVTDMQTAMTAYFEKAYVKTFENISLAKQAAEQLAKQENVHCTPFETEAQTGLWVVENPKHQLAVGTLQDFIDDYLKKQSEAKVDYIHGDDVVGELGKQAGNIGFYLPAMDKHDLFKTVIIDGVLPRKTFSMGEAEEKRFYLECKKISI